MFFFSFKINKNSGYDGARFNVKKLCFGELFKPLKCLFNLSIVKGIFSWRSKNCKGYSNI